MHFKTAEKHYKSKIVLGFFALILVVIGITTLSINTRDTTDTAIKACNESNECYETHVLDTISKKGVPAGFELIENIYTDVPSFRKDCHVFTLILSRKLAYEYPEFKSLKLTPVTTVCNYGFQHAYTEALIEKTGDPEEGIRFCNYTKNTLEQSVPGVEVECYRGVGKGLTLLRPDLDKDHVALASFSIERCMHLTHTDAQYDACANGVFNALGYREPTNKIEPLSLCEAQPTRDLEKKCYGNYKHAAFSAAGVEEGGELEGAISSLEHMFKATSSNSNRDIMYTHGFKWARNNLVVHRKVDVAVGECSKYSPQAQPYCVRGISTGIAKHGSPGKQYELLTTFCDAARTKIVGVTSHDCPSRQAIEYLQGIYPQETFEHVYGYLEGNLGEVYPYEPEN